MCTVLDDDLNDEIKYMEALSMEESKIKNCLKCGSLETSIVLRGNDSYCISCFQMSANHKLRATLGKSRLLRHNDNVLLIYCGGMKTSTMLRIIQNGFGMEFHKKFTFNPYILFIDKGAILGLDLNSRQELCFNVLKNIETYNIPAFLSSMPFAVYSDNLEDIVVNFNENFSTFLCNVNDGKLLNLLHNTATLSAQQDLLNTLERKLVLRIAKLLQCKYVFYPDIASDIASKTLSSFALGRGSHVTLDVGFSDNRDAHVTILRPMRDFTNEEIEAFCKINNLDSIHIANFGETENEYSSIQNLISNFIGDLQTNYPATIHTVIRTADKLVTENCRRKVDDNVGLCKFCLAPLDNLNAVKLSAINATEFSKIASSECSQMIANSNYNRLPMKEDLIDNIYCHACNLTIKDMKNRNIFNEIQPL